MAVVFALAGCPSAPTPRAVDTSTVKQVVGSAGGTLVHPTGAKLVVPAGALAEDVELSLTGAAAPSASTVGAPSVGQAFVMGPEGQQFLVPLSITVPVDPALVEQAQADTSELRLRLAPQSTLAFVELATTADVAAKTLSAQLTHFSIIVPVASANGFTFGTDGLPAASVGVAYSGALVVSGGTGPYTFSVVAGAPPPGLAMSAQGLLSGTPTQPGSFSFTVRVTDSTGSAADAVVVLTVGGVGQCNDVVNAGGLVTEQRVASAPPSPTGGSLAVGTWVRGVTTIYTGAGGASGPSGRVLRQTIRITSVGGALRFDSAYQEPGSGLDLVSGAATPNGTTLDVAFNCPQTATKSFGYSATATALTLYEAVSDGTREMIFYLDGAAPDGGTGFDGGAQTDGGTQTCSGPAASGALVAEQFASGASSQAQGGVLPDGDYELIADAVFESDAGTSGPTGNQRRQTFRVSGSTVSTTIEDSSGIQSAQFTIAYAGPTFTLTPICPATVSSLAFAYSMIAPDRVELMRGSSRGTLVATYQRVGGAADGGMPDAGTDAGVEIIGTGFTDLVDLAYDPGQAFLYTLGGGTVNRCDTAACGGSGSGTLVTNVYASSVAVDNGTLFVTTDFQNVKSCDANACTLSSFAALGANTYPAHLVVANGRVYWMSEAGGSRRVQNCPLAGCGAGPATVYAGTELDGVPVSGLAVTATTLYVASFTGGIWSIPLTDPDTAGAASSLTGSAYGTGGLLVDGTTLSWTETNDNQVRACTLPGCAVVTTVQGGLLGPTGLAADSAYLYGVDRGVPNGSGGTVPGTARVWRKMK